MGEPRGCSNLGLLHELGRGVPVSKGKAAALYERACQGGIAAACANLGGLLQTGDGVAVDQKRARVLFERACEAGVVEACGVER